MASRAISDGFPKSAGFPFGFVSKIDRCLPSGSTVNFTVARVWPSLETVWNQSLWFSGILIRQSGCVYACERFGAVPCLEPEGRWEGFLAIWRGVKLSEQVSVFGESCTNDRGSFLSKSKRHASVSHAFSPVYRVSGGAAVLNNVCYLKRCEHGMRLTPRVMHVNWIFCTTAMEKAINACKNRHWF